MDFVVDKLTPAASTITLTFSEGVDLSYLDVGSSDVNNVVGSGTGIVNETGGKLFNFPVGMSLLVFYAFAMQCMATLAIVKRETKSWKWPLIQLFGMSGLAYVSSLIIYQILS